MTFLNITTLQSWIDEFRELGYPLPAEVRVVPQDGDEGADTGLILAKLSATPTTLYIQPVAVGSQEWCVTFEPRAESSAASPADVTKIAMELTVLGALCAYVEAQARRHIAADAP